MKQSVSYNALSTDDIQYTFREDGSILIQPTTMRGDRRVSLGRAFKYGGRKHLHLMRDMPDVFPDALGITTKRRPSRFQSWQTALAKSYTRTERERLGFKNQRELLTFISTMRLDPNASIEMHKNALQQEREAGGYKSIYRKSGEVIKGFRLSDWQSLGFETRAAGEKWAAFMRRVGKDRVLHVPEFLKAESLRYIQSASMQITDVVLHRRRYYGSTHQYQVQHSGLACDVHRYLDMLIPTATCVVRDFQRRNNPGGELNACALSMNLSVTLVNIALVNVKYNHLFTGEDAAEYREHEASRPGGYAYIRLIEVLGGGTIDYVGAMDAIEDPELRPEMVHELFRRDELVNGGPMRAVYGETAEGIVRETAQYMMDDVEQMEIHGSGWVCLKVNESWINLVDRDPLATASSWFAMPPWIYNRKAVVNIRNDDAACGLYCAIYGKHHTELSTTKKLTAQTRGLIQQYMEKGLSRIPVPVPLSRKVWNQIEDVMQVNIWIWQAKNHSESFAPFEPSPLKYDKDILILYVKNPEDMTQAHYVWVAHPSRLIRANAGSDNQHFPCFKCTVPKHSEHAAKEHQRQCILLEGAKEQMPRACGKKQFLESEEEYQARVEKAGRPRLKFSAWHAMLDVPTYIVYDLEAYNQKTDDLLDRASKSRVKYLQVINSAKILVYDVAEARVWHCEVFSGENPVRQLIDSIKHWSAVINAKYFRNQVDITWTPEDKAAFHAATECCICHGNLRHKPAERFEPEEEEDSDTDEEDTCDEFIKVAHHDHYTGKVFGAAHKSCNLRVKVVKRIPVLCHNMSGYDGHFILKELRRDDYHRMDVLPMNTLKNKMFTLTQRDETVTADFNASLFKFKPRDKSNYSLACKESDIADLIGYKYTVHELKPGYVEVRSRGLYWDVVNSIQGARKCRRAQYKIEFKDTFLFFQGSLDGVTGKMQDSEFAATWEYVDELMRRYDLPSERRQGTFEMCRRKGAYPYEWVGDVSKFDATELPGPEAFFSSLRNQCESWDELNTMTGDLEIDRIKRGKIETIHKACKSAQEVWDWYGFTTFREYHNHYLELDVFLLTDAVNCFRKYFRNTFDLEPLHFCTLPGATWQACLKSVKCDMELFGPKDHDMYQFAELTIRGGVSTVGTRRFVRANNPKVQGYNPREPTKWIYYVDANGLYAYIMTLKLPYGEYEWALMSAEELLSTDVDGDYGYFVEVDVHIKPCVTQCEAYKRWKNGESIDVQLQKVYEQFDNVKHDDGCCCLHDYQADFPCLPENRAAVYEEMSPQQKEWSNNKTSSKKLMPTLLPKTEYKVHLKTLQFAIRHGWEVTKTHRCMRFAQRAWMKSYIDGNNARRAEAKKAKDEYGSRFFKDSNNIVFGKQMEDVRKYKNMRIVGTTGEEKLFKKLINTPQFLNASGVHPINDELCMVELGRDTVLLNKPIFGGASILDLAKLHMQEFWYDTMKKDFGDKVKLIATDTDSFIFSVETEDMDAYIASNPNFHESRPGAFKVENSETIREAVAIRSKVYSLDLEDGSRKATAKGVNEGVKATILHSVYRDTCLKGTTMTVVGYNMRATNQRRVDGGYERQVRVVSEQKLAMSPFNDKSYLCPDGTQLPWGHARIKKLH